MDRSRTGLQGGGDDQSMGQKEGGAGVANKGHRANSQAPRDPRNLGQYVTELEAIADEIEDAEDIDDDMVRRFDEAKGDFQAKVDRFLGFLDALDMSVYLADKRAKAAAERLRVLKRLEKGLKDYMVRQIQEHPDLPWEGTREKIRAQKNSQPSLELEADFGSRSLSDIVFPSHLAIAPELAEFTAMETFYILDKAKVKDRLAQGGEVPFCKLKQGYHPRRKLL